MDDKGATYEWLRSEVTGIKRAAGPGSRTLTWATSGQRLALSRAVDGRIEVFIVGDRVSAVTKSVGDVLEHQTWTAAGEVAFGASRVVLPRGDHFDQFAALLCVELLDNGLEDDPQMAFAAVEPLIALALTRDMVTNLTIMGLIGELALLERLLALAPSEVDAILRAWAGSAPSARDFQLGSVGVEVKTTQGGGSIHQVEGVHQVELGHSNENVVETHLYMLSLGIAWVGDEEAGWSLPDLVDAVLVRLPDPVHQSDVLARIKQYGGDAAIGYDHVNDRAKARYATRFIFKFERLYDLSDDLIKLLTSADLADLTSVDPGSVTFRIVLKDKVRGDKNPIKGWQDLTKRILVDAGYVV